jgi:hypothetical protein
MNTELPDWEAHAALIANTPRLVEAVVAARAALEEAAPYLEFDSDADLSAVRAFGAIHQLLQDMLRVPSARDLPGPQ